MQDSLNNITDPNFNEALIMVFNNRGLQAMEKQNYNEALKSIFKNLRSYPNQILYQNIHY